MAGVVAAVRTCATAFLISVYVLLCGPPLLVWTMATGNARWLYGAAAAGVRFGLALSGIRLEVSGQEHVGGRPAVYASNHSSNVDAPAVFYALRGLFPHLRILYKAELRKLPVLVWAFDAAGFVPLERANPDQSRPAVDRAVAAIALGNSFVIFPEGTRSRTGELLPFKKGGFIMAINAQAPVVPVAVTGGRLAMRKGSRLIWPATVRVAFGAPIETAGLAFEDRDALIERVRSSIAAHLGPGGPLAAGSGQ